MQCGEFIIYYRTAYLNNISFAFMMVVAVHWLLLLEMDLFVREGNESLLPDVFTHQDSQILYVTYRAQLLFFFTRVLFHKSLEFFF